MLPLVEKVCLICEKHFQTRIPRKKYCDNCQYISTRINHLAKKRGVGFEEAKQILKRRLGRKPKVKKPKMKEIVGRTAEVSEAMGVKPDSAERVTKVVEAYWKVSRNIKEVVEKLNLSGGHTYRVYCLGRIVEKNKRGDFKR